MSPHHLLGPGRVPPPPPIPSLMRRRPAPAPAPARSAFGAAPWKPVTCLRSCTKEVIEDITGQEEEGKKSISITIRWKSCHHGCELEPSFPPRLPHRRCDSRGKAVALPLTPRVPLGPESAQPRGAQKPPHSTDSPALRKPPRPAFLPMADPFIPAQTRRSSARTHRDTGFVPVLLLGTQCFPGT